jgi:hypothetical protein
MLKKCVAYLSFSIIMAAALLALSPEVDAWPEFSDVDTEGCRTCHVSDDIHLLPAHSNQDCTNCHDVSDILFPVKPSNCMECHPLESQGDVCNLALQPEHDCAGCLTCHDFEQENCKAIETTTSTTTAPVGHEANNGAVDESNCLVCHDLDGVVHSEPGHTNKDSNGAVCCACHGGLPGRGNVSASSCIVCHPLNNEGECNLVVFGGHQGESGTFPCLSCHEAHGDCEGTETTTSTTSVPGGHKENGAVDATCLVCHEGLHDISAHSNCSACHDESSSGSVNASVCVACHPSGNPGTCNLTLTPEHACAGCLSCHSECPGEISTTTSVTEHAEDGAVDDTNCLLCHDASLGGALHSVLDHNNCCLCHGGTPGKGNVSAPACLACHPQDNSAVCDLVVLDDHKDGPCFNCHNCPGVTTTTTTISSFEEHLVVCYGCHQLSDLHSYQGHSDCAKCHDDGSVGRGW